MKKFLFLAAALVALAAPAANAQRVNTASELKKLDKADATLLDAKKNIKAATWNAHGKAYTDAYILPTKELVRDIPVQTLQMSVGQPLEVVEGQFGGQPVLVARYEYVDVYVNQMYFIVGWKQTKELKENLAETAIESYKKAYELDNKLAPKIQVNAMFLANALSQQGEALNDVGLTKEAAEAFELAFRAQQVVPGTAANAGLIYNAGVLNTQIASTLGETEEAIALFSKAQDLFNEAIEAGYKDNGSIYYFLYHTYYGQRSVNRDEMLASAKQVLLDGIKLYPSNSLILEGLIGLYATEKGIGDPAELIGMLDNSLKATPDNFDLWYGRGIVYNALENYDECIKSFEKCIELRPEDYNANYYMGYFFVMKADGLLNALNSSYNANVDYNAEVEKINLVYAEAIPWFERALAFKPNDAGSINNLTQLCFRLRDMEGMAEKHAQYKAMKDAL